ncbi:unnamed protein product [Fraxinus pennsylvanica]|uniref:Uncharacterized protein n=1 Tax=Fraxinus pennsylvanica TaxID=56036 RepID=A0AAD1Z0F2_9LAMI|nr:unnamed protein product [Fraxinus pennsylvanica]
MEIKNEASNSDNSSDGEELDIQTRQKSYQDIYKQWNPSLASEGKKLRNGNDYTASSFDLSTFTGPSPVLKWTSEVKAADPNMLEPFSRWGRSFKPNTLQEKLLEARLEGLQPCARVSKGLSQVD